MDGLIMKYFVLKPKAKSRLDPYARASQLAMLEYAEQIEDENEKLAKSLKKWAKKEVKSQNEDHPF